MYIFANGQAWKEARRKKKAAKAGINIDEDVVLQHNLSNNPMALEKSGHWLASRSSRLFDGSRRQASMSSKSSFGNESVEGVEAAHAEGLKGIISKQQLQIEQVSPWHQCDTPICTNRVGLGLGASESMAPMRHTNMHQ